MVVAAADSLLVARGGASLAAARLGAEMAAALGRIVRLGAFVHDLGKASEHFQALARGCRSRPEPVRHEALSLWLCWPGQPLAAWLRPAVATDEEYRLALVAGAGHHRRFWRRGVAPAERAGGAGAVATLLVSHEDFRRTLELGTRQLGLGPPPTFEQDVAVAVEGLMGVRADFERWEAGLRDWPSAGSRDARLLAIGKALVIGANVAGSAIHGAAAGPAWIERQLAPRDRGGALRSLVRRRLDGSRPREFQERTAESAAPVTLVRAGCGAGKTVAAYLWAARQHPSRQLWMTGPASGVASEGFRGDLFGGECEERPAVPDAELLGLDDGADGQRDLDRLDAIHAWGRETVTCAAETVLGLMQNRRAGLYAWPSLCGGAVAFDAIHAYDDRLFGALLRFLEALPGIPALLMAVGLPRIRQEALRELVGRIHGAELPVIEGPRDLEALPRHIIRREAVGDAAREAVACLRAGGKVLWVSNRIERCVEAAATVERLGAPRGPLFYHSQFRHGDRVARRQAAIEAFRSEGPALVLATRVVEMGLDLSADLLVTDLAPVPALIQRLGRLKRHITPAESGAPGHCLVVPFIGAPYGAGELEAAERWVAALGDAPASQRDLVAAWETTVGGSAVAAPLSSPWLDGGFATEPAAEWGGAPRVTVLLARDRAAARENPRRLVELRLPMSLPPSRWQDWRAWERQGHVPVAPPDAIDYDPLRGARWRG
jgi:CRISPR-associated endonuclease/helicase Cas3